MAIRLPLICLLVSVTAIAADLTPLYQTLPYQPLSAIYLLPVNYFTDFLYSYSSSPAQLFLMLENLF